MAMRSTAGIRAVASGVDANDEVLWRDRPIPRDARLKREIIHRRLVIARLRRFLRVSSLHVLDAGIVAGASLVGARFVGLSAGFERHLPLIVAIHLLSLNATSSYDAGDGRRDFRRLGMAVALANATLAVLAFFPTRLGVAPMVFVAFAATTWSALAVGRTVVDRLVLQAYRRGIGLRRALLVGTADEAGSAVAKMREGRNADQHIVGRVASGMHPDPAAIGTIERLSELIESEAIQEVIVSSALAPAAMREIAAACFESGTALFVVADVPTAHEYRVESLRVGRCALMRLLPARLEVPGLLMKRVFDVTVSSIVLVVCAPLMAAIAIAIVADSPGPVFFRARRVGLGGQLFDMWKFRSMASDAEKREEELAHLNIYSNGTFKIADDPRVTRVGRWLRRTSLDELPQLFNVLLGNMSLVGPRPALPRDLDRYQPHHFQRLTVIPGITGPWQVGGRNLVTDFETIIGMERQYIQSWSFWLDLKILARTPGVVWRGEGAY